MRPRSIRYYELCYLGAVLASIVVTALTWGANGDTDQVKQIEAVLGSSFLPIFYVFVFTLSLVLWYFTARDPNRVAKWIVVIWFGLSLLGWAAGLAVGNMPNDLPGLLAVAGLVLNAVAIWFLFRPDARAWFGETA